MHMDDPAQSGTDEAGFHNQGVVSNDDLPDKQGPYYNQNPH